MVLPRPPTYIQVAPDSTGKRVVNATVSYDNGDGTTTTFNSQAVVITDLYGNLVLDPSSESLQNMMLVELKAIALGLEHLTGVPLRDLVGAER